MLIRDLTDFLSTDIRRKTLLHYIFSNISPSDIVDETKIPFSTVDRITQLLKAHNILIKSMGRDMRENKYIVDFDKWVIENLKFIGLGFLEDPEKRRIIELMKDKKFFTLSCLFINPEFILDFFEEPLELSDNLPFLILMNMNYINDKPAQLPSSILIYLKFSPLFAKLAKDIENELLTKDIRIINKGIKKYTYVKDMVISEDDLIDYEKKRADLILLLKRIFEKKILRMSLRKEEEPVETD